ncbi:MAG: phosphoenolpyruvate synthase [Streptosporangiales bacterium]|nr:phosphoenolpyruvate synthase [Streptosporangiales bacterium]
MGTQSTTAGDLGTGGGHDGLVLSFEEIGATMLPLVGGKAANLGELTRAGLRVPPGFCVTTEAYELVAAGAGLEPVLASLADSSLAERAEEEAAELAATARERLLSAPVPDAVARAITEGYVRLGHGEPIAVAVRSSATAEDLPFASFAGQQDTYLGVIGAEAALDAVRRCWASLWTECAVSYRTSAGIDHRGVRLAVVIQRMVDARVAGVMFTANPLTGRRRQAVIDASPGLGEAVVSGAVNPDHFVVDPSTGEVLERRLGDKRLLIRAVPEGGTERVELAHPTQGADATACLGDDELAALARLGGRVEDHYGAPQDTEWAIDAEGTQWLTQARPITTLYPLPDVAPPPDGELRVYFSVNVAQGVFRPLTPMGIQMFRLVGSSLAAVVGLRLADPTAGPPIMVVAADRLFLDTTKAIRSSLGRRIVPAVMGIMEARSAPIFRRLFDDPRLSVAHSAWPALRRILPAVLRQGVPFRVVHRVLRPARARLRLARTIEEIRRATAVPAGASAGERLAAVENAVARTVRPLFLGAAAPVLLTYAGLWRVTRKLLGYAATDDELQTVLRGLPYNTTTEMDLELWRISADIGRDPSARALFLDNSPEELARMYGAGGLPSAARRGLTGYLERYGHRGVAEIDIGMPRWADEPDHILGAVANYLRLGDPELAPDVQFERGRRAGEAMAAELARRARGRGRMRGKIVGFCLRRVRAIAGLRETPKFSIVLLFAGIREQLRHVGEELAASGRLESGEDIYFVDLGEAREGLSGRDLRPLVRERRASYRQELRRRHVPRILLSDGTEPENDGSGDVSAETSAGGAADALGALTGTPASPGRVTARTRVVLDPVGAHLEPGEILVAPSTDPGWTPLFLTAGGLVMEMGGAMSHGAVVAREYGIPAVVGVRHATERIETGGLVTVDGSAGTVTAQPPAHQMSPNSPRSDL